MANQTDQIDTSIEIVTPENIAFHYQVAGPFRRLAAYALDILVRSVTFLIGSVGIMFLFSLIGLPSLGFGFFLVFWFLLTWFYGGFFETFWNGQTPGKRWMQLRVLSIDGQPINGLQAVLRNILRTVDQQPFLFCMVGLVSASMNARFQRLGDLACQTMVVFEPRQWFAGVMRFNHPEAVRLAGLIPANFQASRTLARALAGYVQRRIYFPELRRREIAQYLGIPLCERFGLPPDTDHDLLLCGLYQRTFFADWNDERTARVESPLMEPGSPQEPSVEAIVVGPPEEVSGQ